jgi:hypothetical protein
MASPTVLGPIDPLNDADLVALAAGEGPCVSILLPTHRHGPETRQGPIRLRNLTDRAAAELRDAGVGDDDIDTWLAPVRGLIDDQPYWQHQADGLALFAAPGRVSRWRLPAPMPEEVTVAASFRLRPLLPFRSDHDRFVILALSQGSIRLFEATRHTIAELDLGPIPASIDVALAHEDPERQQQFHNSGGPAPQFHGHGAGAELDKAEPADPRWCWPASPTTCRSTGR